MKKKATKKNPVNRLLQNKFLLYFIALIALLDILGYIIKKEYMAVLLFYLVSMITYFYTKNMTVVLSMGLIITTIVHILKDSMNLTEGFKDKKSKAPFSNKKKSTTKSGYQNNMKLKPSMINIPSKDDISKQLGKADEMEKAYDSLEKVVGENGIKSMSNSTKELVKQQKHLVKNLKEITPALDEAVSAVNKIDLSKIMGGFNMFNNKSDKVIDDDE
jgi:hypothetical protein